MSKWSTRFVAKRIDEAVLAGQKELKTGARKEYQEAAEKVADQWSARIKASGRGGSQWNPKMANINAKVTMPKAGGFFVRIGWFDPDGPLAEDGKTSWFVYQDTGYHLFGTSTEIPGLMIQQDMRHLIEVEMRDASDRIARRVEGHFRGL